MSETLEEWRPVPGFRHYEASSEGRVRSLTHTLVNKRGQRVTYKGRVLSPRTDSRGYRRLNLSQDGVVTPHGVHNLVAAAFFGTRPPGLFPCHNNGNPGDNRPVNLRYDTPSENSYDCVRHGRHHKVNRTHCPRGHLLEQPNLVPKRFAKTGRRNCRACGQAAAALARVKAAGGTPPTLQEESDWRYRQIMSVAA